MTHLSMGKVQRDVTKLSFHFNRAKMLKYKLYQRYRVFSKTEEPFELARHCLFWPSYSNLCYTKYLSFVSLDVFKLWLIPSQLFCICSLAQLKIICKIFTASSPNVWGIYFIVCNIANATNKAAYTCVVSSACIPSTFSLSLFCL